MSFLIDTQSLIHIISGSAKDSSLGDILKGISQADIERINISAISHGEVQYFIDGLGPASRAQASAHYHRLLATNRFGQILDLKTDIAETWSKIMAVIRPADFPDVSSEELLTAATAVHYGNTLVCKKNEWIDHLPTLKTKTY